MEKDQQAPDHHRRRKSPPPSTQPVVEGHSHWSICLVKNIAEPVSCVLQNLYHATSTFHRVVVWQLLLIIVAIEHLPRKDADPLLSVVLRMSKIALVGDGIAAITCQLQRQSEASPFLASLLSKALLLTGSCTEMAMTLVLFNKGDTRAAQEFMTGTIYAKLLFGGAVCTISSVLRPAMLQSSAHWSDSKDTLHLLTIGGLLVLASAPHIQSRFALLHHDRTNSCDR